MLSKILEGITFSKSLLFRSEAHEMSSIEIMAGIADFGYLGKLETSPNFRLAFSVSLFEEEKFFHTIPFKSVFILLPPIPLPTSFALKECVTETIRNARYAVVSTASETVLKTGSPR